MCFSEKWYPTRRCHPGHGADKSLRISLWLPHKHGGPEGGEGGRRTAGDPNQNLRQEQYRSLSDSKRIFSSSSGQMSVNKTLCLKCTGSSPGV